MLSEYNLSIESRANKGVYVSGEERDKRRFYHALFPRESIFKNITLLCKI